LKIVPIDRTELFLVRLHAGDTLPEALLRELRERRVTAGTLRLSGVVADVELSAYSAEIEGLGGTKKITGPIQAVVIDASVGVAGGGLAIDMRAVLARETDRGLETIAGELHKARVLGLDGSMTVLVDTVAPRGADRTAGVRLLVDDAVIAPVRAAPTPEPAVFAPPAISQPRPSVPAAAPSVPAPPLAPPSRPVRLEDDGEDGPYPQAGDLVEHFAFGACEVLKSDGDRLHVRMKDGRIREIALEMLKVTSLPAGAGPQRYRLSRRM
jgi:hypothetical protein